VAGQRKPRSKRESAPYSPVSNPPRYVSDATGRAVEVVLSYSDYQELLRLLARHADWEMLPPHLQDAIDNVLADDALAEGGTPIPLRQALAEPGKPAV
jgi:hypothetical protein